MERDFWQSRWSGGSTPWHADAVNPTLIEHIDRLVSGPSRILLPLCGKSVDMGWLAERGHRPIGVELIEDAARAFFFEAGTEPEIESTDSGDRWSGGGVEIRVADIFELDDIGPIDAVWDRAALIALPPDSRRRYVEQIARLAPGAPILLSTVHYDPAVMDGPPFSVSPAEAADLYPGAEPLARADIIDGSRWADLGHRWFESISYLIKSTVDSR